MKARCSGWSFSIVPSPSRVVIAPLAAADTGTEQERADLPSSSTVQAPHWASPQPNLGPFSSRSLRRTYRSGVSGATEDTFRVAPFTRSVKSAMVLLRSGSSAWAGEQSLHLLVQRLHLHDRGVVIIPHPERGRRGRIVHEHAADVGLARERILGEIARLEVHAQEDRKSTRLNSS